jgi:hypothetical protein
MPTVGSVTVVNKKTDSEFPQGQYPGKAMKAYIGRPSPLGNPYKIGEDGSREQVIKRYDQWLRKNAKRTGRVQKLLKAMRKKLDEGHDLELECWCAPLPCHGDIIKAYLEQSVP